jgi:hypothetical protein
VPKSATMLIFCAMTRETSVFKIFPLFTWKTSNYIHLSLLMDSLIFKYVYSL